MTTGSNRRGKHRRFSDWRVETMLKIYEIIFDVSPGQERNVAVLNAVRGAFQTHVAAIISVNHNQERTLTVSAVAGDSDDMTIGRRLGGLGIKNLVDAHGHAQGAITLTRFRRPSLFDEASWEALWSKEMGLSASALVSVPANPQKARPFFVWLLLKGITREWSSHDRELIEEIANLLGRDADKTFGE